MSAALGRGRSCAACASSLPRSTPGVWAIQMDEIQQPPASLAVRIRFRLFLTAGKRPATMRKNLPRGRLVVALDAPHSASIAPRSAEPKPSRRLRRAGEAEGGAKVGGRHRIPVLHAPGDPERGRPSDFSQTCTRWPASRRSCPPRKRPGAGSDFGRSSRWPGAAGWRPRGGGADRPARGVARKLPAASGATIWPLYV